LPAPLNAATTAPDGEIAAAAADGHVQLGIGDRGTSTGQRRVRPRARMSPIVKTYFAVPLQRAGQEVTARRAETGLAGRREPHAD
jgi:hypothetical protein